MQESGEISGEKLSPKISILRAARGFVVRVPLSLPLLVVAGTLLGGQVGWACAAAGLVVACLLRAPRVFLCSVLCGALVWLTQDCRERNLQRTLADSGGGAICLQGVIVSSTPRYFVLETGWLGIRAEIRGEGEWNPGDEVRVMASPVTLHEPPVEGMYSASKRMRGQGVSGAYTAFRVEKTGTSFGIGQLRRLATLCREKLLSRIMPPGTEDDVRRQTLCALVLGEKSEAAPETMELFLRSGCLHAFAVSGLHVGIVAWLVGLLLRAGRVHPRVCRVIILAATGVYVFLTGMAVPALRAYTMLLALLGALILHRRTNLANTWCCAALIVLVVQPWQIYQAGFQLSFAVYAAICLGVRYGMGRKTWFGPDDYLPVRLRNRWERMQMTAELALRGAVIVSLCAWLVSLPLTMSLFHTVNPCSYLTNLALVPILPVVMALGLLWLVLGGVPVLGAALGGLAMRGAGLLISVVSFFSELPGTYLSARRPAEPGEGLVLGLPYGKSISLLGNPGVMVGDVTREGDARYTAWPAAFHAGFSPAWIYGVGKNTPAAGIYTRSWPNAQLCAADELSSPRRFKTRAGVFTIYPAAESLPLRSAENRHPVILWERTDGSRILYAGDAAQSTLESLPPAEQRADILILGRNHRDPIVDPRLLRAIGAGRIIQLPSVIRRGEPSVPVPSGVRMEQLSSPENPLLRIFPPPAQRQ